MYIPIINQIPTFTFFKMPKLLFDDAELKMLSMGAKLLYGLFLDRLSLSLRNEWFDSDHRLYITFSRDEIKDKLNCCNSTATKILKELESKGLICICRKKGTSANIIYINMPAEKLIEVDQPKTDITTESVDKSSICKSMVQNTVAVAQKTDTEVHNTAEIVHISATEVQNSDMHRLKNSPAEVQNLVPNKTNINNTENIKTKYNNLFDIDRDRMEFIKSQYDSIREQIQADTLSKHYGRGLVNNLVENIAEVALVLDDGKGYYRISGKKYPISLVKMRFMEVDYDIADYVLNSIKHALKDAVKVKEYILSSVFNAADTIDIKSEMEVRRDMDSGHLAEFLKSHLARRCAA